MKKYVLSCTLLLIEIGTFCGLAFLLHIPSDIIIQLAIVLFLFVFVFGHYHITSKLIWDEMKALTKAMLCFFVVALVIASLYEGNYLLEIIVISILMLLIEIIADRYLRILYRGWLARRTLIIGTGSEAERFGRITHRNRFALTKVIGYVHFHGEMICDELATLCKHSVRNPETAHIFHELDMERVIEQEKIEQVIIAVPYASKAEINELMNRLHDKVKIIKYIPDLDVLLTFNSQIQDFDGVLLISTAQGTMNIIEKVLKRIIDIAAAFVGILLLIPLTLYVRMRNKKDGDDAPIFFCQKRIGINGKAIKIYKFRTMVPHAERILEEMMKNDPAIREEYLKNKKLVNDPRITKTGAFLRKTSLDEFPQFINVLKGEMSLVGPRPYLFREQEDMGIYYDSIVKCKPGITGMWQANGRSDVGFEERCKLDDYYYRNWTLALDMIVIYKTLRSVVYGKGAM